MSFNMIYVLSLLASSILSLSVVRAGRQSKMTQIYPTFMIYFFIPAVHLHVLELTCPKVFKEEANIVRCRINKTAVRDAECIKVQNYVTFELKVGSSTFSLCHTPSFNSSNCSPVSRSDTDKCWCNGTDGQIFDYTFVYSANKSRDLGAQLNCKICYEPQKDWNTKESESCKEMYFDIPHSDGIQNSNLASGVITISALALFITYVLL